MSYHRQLIVPDTQICAQAIAMQCVCSSATIRRAVLPLMSEGALYKHTQSQPLEQRLRRRRSQPDRTQTEPQRN